VPSPNLQPAAPVAPAPAAAAALDPNRFRLLKRPIDEAGGIGAVDRPPVDPSRR
jgi:hypothetical protein